MSASDGSPQRDDRHHRRSRSRSPVSPGYAGETIAEREEPRLAEAALLVGQPAGQPRAAPADPELPAEEPVPAEEAAPAAHAAARTMPLVRGTGPARAPSASPGAAAARAEGREGTK